MKKSSFSYVKRLLMKLETVFALAGQMFAFDAFRRLSNTPRNSRLRNREFFSVGTFSFWLSKFFRCAYQMCVNKYSRVVFWARKIRHFLNFFFLVFSRIYCRIYLFSLRFLFLSNGFLLFLFAHFVFFFKINYLINFKLFKINFLFLEHFN